MWIYAVYKNPKDYPGKFVVRKWWFTIPHPTIEGQADTLEEARQFIPEGMTLIPKQEGEDPVIVESYI